jgi:rhomboid protease GluP
VELIKEEGPGADPWDVAALAVCETLRGRPGVHVVPDAPEAVLRGAARSYLALDPGEIVLAVVDTSDGAAPSGGCALTNRRVCWFVPPAEEQAPPRRNGGLMNATRAPSVYRISGQSAAYEALPEVLATSGWTRRELDLGDDRRLSPEGLSDEGFAALADALETLGRAARTRDLAGATTPEALDRARRDVAAAAACSEPLRHASHERRAFFRAASEARPNTFVTRAIVSACVLVFVAMVATGVSPIVPDAPTVFRWGGLRGIALVEDRQWWRLGTAMFLHYGLIHLALNMWCLRSAGPLVERLYGHAGFAALYLASGLGASLASAWWRPFSVGAGASGAIFGVIGGLLAFLVRHRSAIPASVLQSLRSSTLAFVGYNIVPGLFVEWIDNAGHLGGLATGFLAGLVLSPIWPPSTRRTPLRLAVRVAIVAAGLGGAGWAVAHQVRRNPEILRFERLTRSYQAYSAFIAAVDRPIQRQQAVEDRMVALCNELQSGAKRPEDVRPALDELIVEETSTRAEVAKLKLADPDLEPARRALLDAGDALLDSLNSLAAQADAPNGHTLSDRDVAFFASQARLLNASREFERLYTAYLHDHGLDGNPAEGR